MTAKILRADADAAAFFCQQHRPEKKFMGPIKTTIVGSLPKPEWLSDPEQLRAPWRQEGTALEQAQDDAVALTLAAQEQAGLDIVCDGEQRRRHYIWGFI